MSCIFCKIISGEFSSKIAYEDEDIFAFHDINPVAPVHVLIVPKTHIAKVSDTKAEHTLLMGKLVNAARHIATDLNLAESGYRLVINNGESASQSVFHVHLHLLGGRSFTWPPG